MRLRCFGLSATACCGVVFAAEVVCVVAVADVVGAGADDL